ncbi:MAG: Gfo/Idh/MocA family oxidoreductase [Acidobacteriota bacterium]|nr:Gfo/Idh/MocA family oxidoreductase [Acidobacteriota bacterium]
MSVIPKRVKLDRPLRAGLIGAGHQNISDHLPTIERRVDVEVVYIYDTDAQASARLAQSNPEISVPIVNDFDILLEAELDFCVVAVPHDQHVAISKTLCAAQIPFMKEKPFARTLDETIELASVPDMTKFCFVCTQRRFHPLYRSAKEALKDLGTIASFDVQYSLNLPKSVEGWRASMDVSGGGVIIDMGYHIIDQLTWWFGYPDDVNARVSRIAEASDDYETEDAASISFEYYAPPLQGTIVLSRCSGSRVERYQVAGSKFSLEGSKSNLRIIDRAGGVRIDRQGNYGQEMLDRQLSFFLETMLDGRNFERNHWDNLQNMKLVERCYRSGISRDAALFIAQFPRGGTKPQRAW